MSCKITELQTAKGQKQKIEILKKYSGDSDFCKLLYYALNPLLTYNISEKTLRMLETFDAASNSRLVFFKDIYECCEYLSRLRGIDAATIRQVKLFLYNHCTVEDREVYIKILSKTLRLGVTAKTVNKIIPGLIPEWEVQQAFPVEKYPLPEGTEFWVTQKLNGVRATFYNGQFIARSGAHFGGLEHIIKELSWTNVAGLVLDGELTLKNKGNLSDNEAFRVATGLLNSDNVNKTEICFTIFDVIPIKDFDSAEPQISYSYRRSMLEEVSHTIHESEYVNVLPVLYYGSDQTKIDELLELMVEEDKEGLMLNTDVPYKRTRHRGILKVKRFYTMDLPIIRCEEGDGRLEGTLGALVLDYQGNEVKVGSGFTDPQREELWRLRNDLVGTLCEVKYKEVSSDKHTGLESLQFPVFVRLRTDKAEVSYG